jgi:hypothetical protein
VQGSPALCTSWVSGQCYNPSCRSAPHYLNCFWKILFLEELLGQLKSVGDSDPEPDPQDPHVFGPPGSTLFLLNVLSGLN